ncbi:MAG: RDD family protein [Verrucomicrobiales bacterium]|nr:RDD family protein [Verrucomicrobiales bacterium]
MLGQTTSLEVRTLEGVTFSVPIASPFSRCLALAVDFAVVVALTLLISQFIGIFQSSVAEIPVIGSILSDFGAGATILLQFIVFTFYGMVTEWLWSGQTVGKRLFKLRVIDDRGLSLGVKQIVIRNLFRLLDILPSTFYLIGSISCLITKRCQRIGDIAAGTLVIREIEAKPPEFEEMLAPGENSFSTKPLLEARLRQNTSPEEARIALDAVARRNELSPDNRLHLFSQIANHFREVAEFPDEVTAGLSDEQYVRNVADTLFRRARV